MNKLPTLLIMLLVFSMAHVARADENAVSALPSWQQLKFEQKAFWATARSQLKIVPVTGEPNVWVLDVLSSVVDNFEQLQISFDPTTGRVLSCSRISRGKEQRMKSYQYETDFILRERRNSPADPNAPPEQWPVSSTQQLKYPASTGDTIVSNPYMLMVLAAQLQAKGPGQSREVIVHTDMNFYRVKLTSGNGVPVTADYQLNGQDTISGKFETLAVAIQASPEGALVDDDDFNVLGLRGEIILLFDRESGLPLQIRGDAPRIGGTEINLKSATLRTAP